MALGTSTNKIFLSVADGKIVHKVTEATPGATPRAKADGNIVYEMRYAFITGILTGISTKTNLYQGTEMKDWLFDMTDGNENYQLQIMYDSRYATSLLNALANPSIDFTRPITITPWMKVVDNKKKTSCYLKQGEVSIDWFFTKENPNGLPELKQVIFQGKERWDSYDRMQFFETYVATKIKPKLQTPFRPEQSTPAYVPPAVPGYSAEDLPEDDDLPF